MYVDANVYKELGEDPSVNMHCLENIKCLWSLCLFYWK